MKFLIVGFKEIESKKNGKLYTIVYTVSARKGITGQIAENHILEGSHVFECGKEYSPVLVIDDFGKFKITDFKLI